MKSCLLDVVMRSGDSCRIDGELVVLIRLWTGYRKWSGVLCINIKLKIGKNI